MSLGALGRALAGPAGRCWRSTRPVARRARSAASSPTNASGPLRFRYGTARDLTLGVRFVQADGTITWGGAKVVKSVTGYDVPKLLVGSLGTLGIIVERHAEAPSASAGQGLVALRVADARRERKVSWRRSMASSLEPDRVTLLNGEASRALRLLGRKAGSPRLDRQCRPRLSRARATRWRGWPGLTVARSRSCPSRAGSSSTGSSRATSAPAQQRAQAPGLLARRGRASGLAPRAARLVGGARRERRDACSASGQGVRRRRWTSNLLRPLREALAAEGGSVVVERAPAQLKVSFDVWGPIQLDSQAIMSRVKMQFDPEGILNPGRFVGGL